MISSFFAPTGPLSQKLPHFIARDAQLEMAEAVAIAIKNSSNLVVEAETGTGKTFAYLAPTLLSFDKDKSPKIIVSTGSKALQEQLFIKDLPILIETTRFTGSVALLKGRSNYLCNERLNRFMLETKHKDQHMHTELVKVKNWSLATRVGDIAEINDLAEDAAIIPAITSNNDNCLGRQCPSFDDCFIVKARKKAMHSDLIVINHHLFFADLAVKETGFGELMPEAGVYIFDEAHQLPDIASLYFGESLSHRQLIDLAKEIDFVYRSELKEAKQMAKAAEQLRICTLDFRLAFALDKGSGSWRDKSRERIMQLHMQRLLQVMDFLKEVIGDLLGKSEVLDHSFDRLNQFTLLLKKLNSVNETGFSYWFDCSKLHFSLNITPLSVADRFQSECQKKQAAWIFTSATLSVKGLFDHFTELLGLQNSQCLQLSSPFDYAKQSLFVVPRLLPEPDPRLSRKTN
ncbi:ATP-dependent DNA helicase [Psychromonas sp. MME2]|uniref:ATP-dependent DNA helicase n=1 Tax=Psychromonas sp. MME2 TaxID=3231033 RepID=UPI00339C68BB